ncbi:MAG TPA: archaeosortase/exosortase family protein, partial [Pyrinomonadaceae bacterium]|nr:archaeosortase/exosortase family protein [Pyrinomonadaceae bacterium]
LEVVEACSGIRSLMTLVTLAVVFAYFTHPRSGNKAGGDNTGNDSGEQRSSHILMSALSRLRTYGFWRSMAIVLSAIPIAIFTNALRVSGTGVLAHYYGTKVADGFFHSFSGWVVYVVAFLMLFGVGWILDRLKPAGVNPANQGSAKASRASGSVAATGAPQLVQVEGAE